ncbi:class III lanthionine synthetase LanKC [Streptacidiphilus sp. EB103A]|uniref:class III lanthionine synthetase LanKC n=1 Tax=Streptacidiphilus sp. EB103A TaxID=3156275 RepID=UPI0035110333
MIGIHHAYAGADPHFYDHPAGTSGRGRFAAAGRPVPAGWRRDESSSWVYLTPDGVRLPDQGWKVHVSATPGDAEPLIETVGAYCTEHRIAYKFLPSRGAHLLSDSKYARRGSSGKLITVYPQDERELRRLLEDLTPRVAGRRGPYILSDLRWRDGPLYVRYGAFRERYCITADGQRVPAVTRPDGVLVPDLRAPSFQLPRWVEPPDFITEQIQARAVAGAGHDLPYTVERALHFSNGGGIYLARDERTGASLVLREARPMAGLDGSGIDAVARLKNEARVLKSLADLDFVPDLLDEFSVWEHQFLAQEYIEGDTLQTFMARQNPLTRANPSPAAIAQYTAQVLDILDQLQRAIDTIHQRGFAFADLHPGNVLLRPDGRIALVDFEVAYRPGLERAPEIACPGYFSPHAGAGIARDHYALDSLRLALFLPLTMLLDLDPTKADSLTSALAELFPVPAELVNGIRRGLTRPGTPVRTGPPLTEMFTRAAADPDSAAMGDLQAALVRAITASATPERTDRLFPGDPAALRDGGYTLAHGAAGVLYALAGTGHDVDPEHTEWLWQATRRSTDPRPGLYGGLHGAALTLHILGRTDQALDILERAGAATDSTTCATELHDGLAGIGLTLRHFLRATGETALRAPLQAVVDRVAAAIQAPDDAVQPSAARAGLMHGPTGAALLLLHLFEDTRDDAYLDLAHRALSSDLDHCQTDNEGAVNLHDGTRLLPYLSVGSGGIALVLRHFLRHRHDERFATALGGTLLAAQAHFVVQSTLFNGRASMIALLAQHPGDSQARTSLARHVRLLAWHAVPYRDGIAFPGDQLHRLSMDLATGTAGVLLALQAVARPDSSLPGLASPGIHLLPH